MGVSENQGYLILGSSSFYYLGYYVRVPYFRKPPYRYSGSFGLKLLEGIYAVVILEPSGLPVSDYITYTLPSTVGGDMNPSHYLKNLKVWELGYNPDYG